MIDVERTLLALDLKLVSQRGVEVQGYCPMHKSRLGKEDHNPSWWINLESGFHFCFSCGYKGNLYSLVRDVREIDYFEAKEFIDSDIELPTDVLLDKIKNLPQYVQVDDPLPMSEARLAVFTDVPDIELKKRFLTRESVDAYGVKWDKEHEAWIIPIRDPNTHALWGWQEKGARGRFFRNQPAGVKKSKTIFGVELQELITVVVESPLDVLRLRSIGLHGAIATFGAIISEEQAKLIRRSELVYAAFDNDEAGRKANEQMLVFARKYGIELKYFNYEGSDVKDVGDMTKEQIQYGMKNAKDRVWGKAAYL